MKKSLKVQNVGHGVHVRAEAEDEIGEMDMTFKVTAKNKDHVKMIQEAWAQTATAVEAAPDVPSAVRSAVQTMLEHLQKMRDVIK